MNYRDYLQKVIYQIINPLIGLMIKMGVTPNSITAAGLVGNVIATCFFIEAALRLDAAPMSAYALIGWGGGVILFAGLFDMMDGRLARMSGKSSSFGALWDSTLDRYSELFTLFGVAVIFLRSSDEMWFVIGVATFLAMVGSIMVSYVRARAEGLGIECKVGLMQRPERVVVTAAGAIVSGLTANLWWLAGAMVLIALLANFTACWRILHCYRQLS